MYYIANETEAQQQKNGAADDRTDGAYADFQSSSIHLTVLELVSGVQPKAESTTKNNAILLQAKTLSSAYRCIFL